jgi:AcrR family transcriptional regulator
VSRSDSGASARAGRPRDPATDRAITEATFRLLREEGYRGMSIEGVAARSGVAKTTIYRRYRSKHELVVAAVLAETPFPAPPPDLPTREALATIAHQAVQMLVGAGAIHVLATVLAEEEREPELLATLRARLIEPRRDMLLTILRRGVQRREVRADARLEAIPEAMLGSVLVHHITGGIADEAWINGLVETIWRAIGLQGASG